MNDKAGKKKSVLFVYTSFSSFVNNDFTSLASICPVKKYCFAPVKGILKNSLEFIKQFFFLLFSGWKYDIYYCWFADYHSFLPVIFAKIFGKKSFVVIGGYDVSNMPEYHYGAFSNPFRAFFSRNTIKFADTCFPVAEALKEKILQINPGANAETLATNFDSEKFCFKDYSREKSIVTVSFTENHQRYMIKGLDRFRELCVLLPDFEFTVIGITRIAEPLFDPKPGNLILLPPVPYDQICNIYQKSSFYAQLSRSEGLPNALCEAMLSGCIPIGTNVGDIKIAVGNSGITMDEWQPELLAEFVRLNHNNIELRNTARAQILNLYHKDTRTERFNKLIRE
jgi:glycosyltransferase involved in cell wall biosynthesis